MGNLDTRNMQVILFAVLPCLIRHRMSLVHSYWIRHKLRVMVALDTADMIDRDHVQKDNSTALFLQLTRKGNPESRSRLRPLSLRSHMILGLINTIS